MLHDFLTGNRQAIVQQPVHKIGGAVQRVILLPNTCLADGSVWLVYRSWIHLLAWVGAFGWQLVRLQCVQLIPEGAA